MPKFSKYNLVGARNMLVPYKMFIALKKIADNRNEKTTWADVAREYLELAIRADLDRNIIIEKKEKRF